MKSLVAGLIAIVVALAGISALAPVLAQESQLPEGVSVEVTASGTYEALPEGAGVINLARYTLAPGAELSFPDGDPSLGIIIIESGALTLSATQDLTIRRAAGEGTPFAGGAEESVPANTTVILQVGDSVLMPSGSGATFSNEGDIPVVCAGAHVIPLSAAGA